MKKFFSFLFFLSGISIILIATSCTCRRNIHAANPKAPELVVVSPPNPNVFPVFIMLKDNPELNIRLIAVPSGKDIVPYFQSGKADITTIYSYIMADHVVKGDIPDLQLRAITLWNNFYIVASPNVNSFDELVGKTILVTGPSGTGKNGAPDKILHAAILRTGHHLSDFNIQYKEIDNAMVEVIYGKADAILLAEPAAIGFVMKARMSNVSLKKAVDLQSVFSGYKSWTNGQLPLGGVATLKTYESKEKAKAVEAFVKAYKQAAQKIMDHKFSSAKYISSGLSQYYKRTVPTLMVLKSLNDGTLLFSDKIKIAEIKPELKNFITELIGKTPDDEFFKDEDNIFQNHIK
jgi:ABC-type nitrate/sulfonate/bicarbonate transport system substrate-binding protein